MMRLGRCVPLRVSVVFALVYNLFGKDSQQISNVSDCFSECTQCPGSVRQKKKRKKFCQFNVFTEQEHCV